MPLRELKDQPHPLQTRGGAHVTVLALVRERDDTPGGLAESGDEVQEGGLAETRSAHDEVQPRGGYAEVHLLQHHRAAVHGGELEAIHDEPAAGYVRGHGESRRSVPTTGSLLTRALRRPDDVNPRAGGRRAVASEHGRRARSAVTVDVAPCTRHRGRARRGGRSSRRGVHLRRGPTPGGTV